MREMGDLSGRLDDLSMDLPIDSMVIFHSYVKLPEGNQYDHDMIMI